MRNRSILLASLAASLCLGGCVIHSGPKNNARRGPPPPPPPAAQPGQPAQPPPAQPPPAQPPPAQPPTLGLPRLPGLVPPQAQQGTISIVVSDGNCAITIDGAPRGTHQRFDEKVAPGSHTIGCQPTSGPLQTRAATVAANAITTVTFQLGNPGNTHVTLPVNVLPPVGRPTPQ